ncbi:TetR/AcrR family transcriptional regulator [Nonomuraea angiospora]|uniref:HTH tetR-type domain-containing protein n=1 Tax=Nonomuraea angiospora TaxID=46172 RepID=A0ABR9LQH1_9ACTN|nr:TetR/AcrR family transcriptional regulator [Nonomuraea angiospora]MBE1582889.1 hypothetical protein [Nonomuraea angiospora]
MPLDRERIVTGTIALADEGGLEAVSLRKVAARLDAGPMRLYAYISTKEELFDLMVDEVHAEVLPEEQPGDWPEALRVLAHRTRGHVDGRGRAGQVLGRLDGVDPIHRVGLQRVVATGPLGEGCDGGAFALAVGRRQLGELGQVRTDRSGGQHAERGHRPASPFLPAEPPAGGGITFPPCPGVEEPRNSHWQ